MKLTSLFAAAFVAGGLIATNRVWFWAGGEFMGVISALLHLPVVVIACLLLRGKQRGTVRDVALLSSSALTCVWFCLFAHLSSQDVKRPGHEGDGMFGVLLLLGPLISSAVGSLLAVTGFYQPRTRGRSG